MGIVTIVKSQFEQFKERIKEVYNYDLFEEKHESVHYFLYSEIERTNQEVKQAIKELTFEPKFIAVEIVDWMKFLAKDIELKKKSPNSIKRELGKHLNNFHEILAEISLTLPEIDSEEIRANKIRRKPVVSDYNRPIIKQRQVLLLMHYFKKNKLVISDIEDRTLAELFGDLTGFSGEQLRKEYSSFKNDGIEYKNEDITALKDILVKISEDIAKSYDK